MTDYMKRPCPHCPYRRDVKPYLTPARGDELAYLAQNPYNVFWCHKTTESDDDDSGECHATAKSKVCTGFLSLQANECGEQHVPEGFEPAHDIVYCESWEMSEAYEMARDD